MELKETLLAAKSRLFEAAKEACSDKAFAYDALYLAVIKTKQKYKKLVNKERVVEICISLMKQPRKHVKQSFASVEDCIEKALAAKVVPRKPIVSSVAVALAAAILIPLCFAGNSQPAEVGGFEMENTVSIANEFSENETYLKNFHKTQDFGVINTESLLGIPSSKTRNGRIFHDTVTTENDTTYMVAAYTYADEKRAEFILYRADTDGWTEIGQADIGFFTETSSSTLTSRYLIGSVAIYSSKDTVYIVSTYDEGIQIHQYSQRSGLIKIGSQKIADKRQIYVLGTTTYQWFSNINYYFDSNTQTIYTLYSAQTTFLKDADDSAEEVQLCLAAYDLENQSFSSPSYFAANFANYPLGITTDGTGGYYLLGLDTLDTIDSFGLNRLGIVLCRFKDGVLTKKMLIHSDKVSALVARMFEIDEAGALHIVYQEFNPNNFTYIKIENDIIVEQCKIKPTETTVAHQDFISFYRNDNILYFTELLYEKHLVFAKCENGTSTKLADFSLPLAMEPYFSTESRVSSPVYQERIINVLLMPSYPEPGADELPFYTQEVYFAQIICEYEE